MLAFIGFCTCWVGLIRIKKTKPLNIVFDLDNTLIMSLDKKRYEHMRISHIPHIQMITRVVWIRPWVKPVLYILSKFTKLYLFTRADKIYTDLILEQAKIDSYFIDKKYKSDCEYNLHKDIGQFSPSYKKLLGYSSKLKILNSYDNPDEHIIKLKQKICSEIKSHQSKLAKFIGRTILVDDKITNKLPGQNFYHIDYYQFGMIWDITMLKLLGWIGYRSFTNAII
jgi:hypothetical protein